MSNVFMADFETTTEESDCRVWLWGLMDIISEDWSYGTNIDEFMREVNSIGDSVVYFHNLAFDGMFIIPWVFTHGFVWKPTNKLKVGEFTSLISRMGKFYTITVVMDNARIEFRDSLKKLPLSVKAIGETYNVGATKGSIDYRMHRDKDYVPSEREIDYLHNDIAIPARALHIMTDEGMSSITIGADSLREYKGIVGGKDQFRALFPVLQPWIDEEIRKAYRGGWCYCSPRYQRRIVGPGIVLDVNSLYPYVMLSRTMPYGEPEYFTGIPPCRDDMPLWVASVTFSALLKPDHVPCIQIKGSFSYAPTEYLSEFESVTMVVTSVDWELWNEQYDIDVECWNNGFLFKVIDGVFDTYISKWRAVKETSKGGMRAIAKLHLNSLYGKFATNPDVTGKVPCMQDDGIVKLELGAPEVRDPVYTPVGVFITAYARQITVRAAQQNYESFAYADTDSLHLIGVSVDDIALPIDSSEFGAWDFERHFDRAVYLRAKAYLEETDLPRYHRKHPRIERNTHIAGLPASLCVDLRMSDLLHGTIVGGKLLPKRVVNGIVLTETSYEIK